MQLPNYLKRSPKTGIFSFRMGVPKRLRPSIGKREVKLSLKTKDSRLAIVQAMKLAEEWKGRFRLVEQSLGGGTGSSLSDLTLFDETLSWLHSLNWENKPISRMRTPEEEYQDRMDYADGLIDQSQRKPDPLTNMKIAALYGDLKRPKPSVKDAVSFYLQERNKPGQRSEAKSRSFEQHIRRNERYLLASLKKDKPLIEVSREDARRFRDWLEERKDARDGASLSPQSVNRSLQAVKAIYNHAVTEWQLNVTNPFNGLESRDPESSRDKRRSFTEQELSDYLSAASKKMNAEAKHCTVIMAYTGARTAEITGLEIQDVKIEGDIPHIVLKSNQTRMSLKTAASRRVIPLLGQALDSAKEAVDEAKRSHEGACPQDAPLFPRYARPRGEDALSALQNKLIRKTMKITDPKLTAYSTRHRMKDKLRNALIDSDLQDAIMGHSRGQISDSYGDGYWLDVISNALKKALPST